MLFTLEVEDLAERKIPKRTAEDRRRWLENYRRMEALIERRLERDGSTREEIRRRLGLAR